VGVEHKTLENWVVAGSLEPKKLGEPINLPKGSTFNGTTTIEFENFFENPHGSLGGTVTVPPFEAALRLLGIVPTKVGVTFEQVAQPKAPSRLFPPPTVRALPATTRAWT
jgi:hypothetical protein